MPSTFTRVYFYRRLGITSHLSSMLRLLRQGRYFVALSLEEAEHLRGALQGDPSHWSNEKNLGWLGYIGDEILPSYRGIIIDHYKDP